MLAVPAHAPRRLARLSGGLIIAATAALLAASPAHAAEGANVRMQGTVALVTGSTSDDSIIVSATATPGKVRVRNTLGSVQAGLGCVQVGSAAECSGVARLSYLGRSGNDLFSNRTAFPSSLDGGSGQDRLSGGSGDDRITGSTGPDDVAIGGAGFDSCFAEHEFECEF